jgi:cytochrome c-type biogenesis protein CcmH
MTTFWIICALLLVVAVLFVVLPLWRKSVKENQVLRDVANLEIFRDQIAEMDADLRNGLLTPELHEQGIRELQSRLLEEVQSTDQESQTLARNPHKKMAITLAVLVPLIAVGLYLKIGNPNAFLSPSEQSNAGGFATAKSEAALKQLEDKVAQNPQDTESMGMLARTYAEQERFTDAVKVYNKLTQLIPNDAQLWADYADALAMTNGQSLAGHPTLLLNKALSLNPKNPKALALAGSAAMGRGEFAAAIKYWDDLLRMLPENSDDAKMISDGIQQARTAIAQGKGVIKGMPPASMANAQPSAGGDATSPAVSGKEGITGTVSLTAAMKSHANPDDTVFILARAAEGPPMPLAVMRKQVRDLPLQFTLDDSMAMAPQMKISNFDKVMVVARISKSGQPMPQTGDVQGMSQPIKPGTHGVKISIDTLVK